MKNATMDVRTVIRVCLVDDDEDYFVITRDLLAESDSYSFSVKWISSFEAACEEIRTTDYDVFLFDYRLGKDNGLDLLKEVIAKGIRTPVIMLTGQGDKDIDLEAMRRGAADYLVKGNIDAALLERSIRYALEHNKTLEQLRTSRDSLYVTTQKLEKALSDINEELETAQRVQKSLLPQNLGGIIGVDLAVEYLPSGAVGGDMYDIVRIDGDRTAFLILDVCGHGVPAALITAMSKVSFARMIYKFDSPRVIFTQVNGELCRFMPDGRYVTAFLGILDLAKKTFTFSRAGHPPVAHASAEKHTVKYLTMAAPLIGCFPDSEFEEADVPVSGGDVLVFYTDGLVESVNGEGDHFNMQDFEKAILDNMDKPVKHILSDISSALRTFRGSEPQADDVTILVVKIGSLAV
jgi:serine phosphatase RsbU (regulator of sigma subunit)